MVPATFEQPRLKFVEVLGKGAFGTVYLAEMTTSRGLHQRVAVKVLHFEGDELAEVIARHRDEARLLAQLNHDHVVNVLDLIEVHGRPALVMEFVEGVDLETVVKRSGPLPVRVMASALVSVAGVLHTAYEAESPLTHRPLRAVHRDIKPANILLTSGGVIRVLDFGVAKADFDRDARTRDGRVGTPVYMSPENWEEGEIGPASDVYALGLTAIRLLSGARMERMPMRVDRHDARADELVRMAVPEADDEGGAQALRALLREMLARSPTDRPTAAEVEERALALTDRGAGDSLISYARRVVPPLVNERRAQLGNAPLPEPVEVKLSEHSQLLSALPVVVEHTGGSRTTKANVARRRLIGVAGALGAALIFGAVALTPRREEASTESSAPTPAATAVAPVTDLDIASTPMAATSSPPAPAAVPATTARTSATRAAPAGAARSGCKGGTFRIAISSKPSGAAFSIDGESQGTTPATVSLCSGKYRLSGGDADIGLYTWRDIQVGKGQSTHYTLVVSDQVWMDR